MVFTGCEVYNLGTGKGTSVLEMVRAFEMASGKVNRIMYLFLVLYMPIVNIILAINFNVIF